MNMILFTGFDISDVGIKNAVTSSFYFFLTFLLFFKNSQYIGINSTLNGKSAGLHYSGYYIITLSRFTKKKGEKR